MSLSYVRRRKNLVDREIQFGFARMVFCYLILYTFFLVLTFGIPLWWIPNSLETGKMPFMGMFTTKGWTFGFLTAGFIVLVTLHSIVVTRKVAGPIFVMRRQLIRARNGEISRIRLRRADCLHDLSGLLNDHFDRLTVMLQDMNTSVQVVRKNLDRLEPEIAEKADDPASPSPLTEIREELIRLESIAGQTWRPIDSASS
ncbi:hypothetical protein JXA40_01300 [bacterium]|nr:hypothetical protein [candidate division CSSED10-310 bacterium]